jgi:hypothetical protein
MNPLIQNRIAAQHLAAQGQGNDDILVHMSGKEVAGLQALAQKHGLSMSTNPRTGLPEAFSLDSLLPAIAGIGLTALTGLPAWEIGLGVGGADALATGSLQKGLMAGLGAYGGSDLGSALSAAGAGAGTAAPTATQLISAAPGTAATDMTMDLPASTGSLGATPSAASTQGIFSTPDYSAYTPSAGASAGNAATFNMPSSASDYDLGVQGAPANAAPSVSSMSNGIANLTSPEGRSAFMSALGNGGPFESAKYNQMFAAGALAANPLFYGASTQAPNSALTNLEDTVRPYTFTQTPNAAAGAPGSASTPYFTQTFTALPTYVAGTNQSSTIPTSQPLAGGGLTKGYARGETLHGTIGALRGVERLTKMATGGISNLGSYSDGGQLLRGPGDGVSDSIPAQIGEHQPARLAEGEFVVPARIVSELGNGSTNAGAQQLYKMIDRIQAGRRGTMGAKHSYANDTDASKHLPA